MKKLYSLAFAMLAGSMASTASAAAIEINGTPYDDLASAIAAATNDDVIMINENITLSNEINTGGFKDNYDKQLHFKGANPSITITYEGTGRIMLANNNNRGKLFFEDLVFQGKGQSRNGTYFEAGDNGNNNITFTNVKIDNLVSIHNQGIMAAKSGGKVFLNGVTITNCTVNEGRGQVFIGSGGSTISGNNNLSLYLEKTNTIAASNVSNTTPVTVLLDANQYNIGRNVIMGCNDPAQFVLADNDQFVLAASGDNLAVSDPTADESKMPVYNETSKKGFGTFTDAWNAAVAGDVLIVNEDQTVTSRLSKAFASKEETLTVKGKTADIKLIRKTNQLMFLNNAGLATIAFENITLDGDNLNPGNVCGFESQKSSPFIFTNVKIINFKSENGQGIVSNKNAGYSVFNNVTFENCTVNEGRGEVFVGNETSATTLKGDNKFTLFIEGNASINASELTNTTPIEVIFDSNREANPLVVTGWNTPANFTTSSFNLMFVADGDNLNVVGNTAINDINVDNVDAPVEYYNLQGVRVYNPENGLYIRRQGNTVTKVLVK